MKTVNLNDVVNVLISLEEPIVYSCLQVLSVTPASFFSLEEEALAQTKKNREEIEETIALYNNTFKQNDILTSLFHRSFSGDDFYRNEGEEINTLSDLISQMTLNLAPSVFTNYFLFFNQHTELLKENVYNSKLIISNANISLLELINFRVHFGGCYVAEAKYQSNPQEWDDLIALNDIEKMTDSLRRTNVEEEIIHRIGVRVRKSFNSDNQAEVVNLIQELYRQIIIPLTIEAEILYLIERFTLI